MVMATEKLLPQNVEAEAGVLGSLLIDPDAMAQIADFLRPDDFYREAHRVVYQAISDLYETSTPADLITLTDELQRRGKLDEVGGASYVSSLANQVPTSANIESYARIVERTAILRRLIHAAGQIAGVAYNEPDANVALDQAEKLIFNVSQRISHAEFEHIRDTLEAYLDKLGQLHARHGDIVGVATGFSDLDKMTGGLQRSDLVILAARPAVGKCLTAHTLIDDPETGARLTIEECVQRRLPTVFGLSEEGSIRPTAVSDWVDSGIQPCFRVTTHSGRTVEVTGHHPFLTVHGWKPLHDLHIGDTIATPRAVPAFGGDDSWEPQLVRLLAYFIAEGGVTDSSPAFTNTDPILIDDFKSAIERHFPECALRQEKSTRIVARPRRAGAAQQPSPVTTWLLDLGLWGKQAREKAFPECVWRWNRERLADFLRTLMSSDGSIYASGSGHPRIELVVASERLASDICHALIRFGIVAKVDQMSDRAWRLQITEPQSVTRYQREIGWLGEKASRFATYTREAPTKSSAIGHSPRETWALVRHAARAQGLSMSELARRGSEMSRTGARAGYTPLMNRTLPGARLARYANILRDSRRARAASPDLYWDRIIAIEPIGDQQVYDLTVPDGANFIAQDIIVHNTALALSVAHNAALRFQHGIAIFSLEMSAEQLIARFLSMDAGVDQQKLRTGFIDDDEWERISQSVGTLSEANIYIDDTPGISLMEMRSKARRLKMERGFDLIIVDYLQLMQGTVNSNGRSNENRVQEISAISRGLKELARELDVPVLALSQLSRAVESRTDKKPQLSDLRESGCLAGDTPVYLPDEGVYQPISALVGRTGLRALALNTETWKLEPAAITNAFATGHKPVYRLTTRRRRSIRATANHKFLTISGWRRLDELTAGDRIAVPRALPGPAASERLTHGKRNPIAAWLDDLGVFGLRSYEKFVPAKVFAQPVEGIARFLRHLWTTDGCIRIRSAVWQSHALPAMRAVGLTHRGFQAALGQEYGGSKLYQQNMSRERAMRVAAITRSKELVRLAESDTSWDEIISIEPDGEDDVYDLTVEGAHNFVAADITVHNSIEQDADIVMFIYRDDVYNPESDRKNIADIIIAKHRNGPVGMVSLYFQGAQTRYRDLELRQIEPDY